MLLIFQNLHSSQVDKLHISAVPDAHHERYQLMLVHIRQERKPAEKPVDVGICVRNMLMLQLRNVHRILFFNIKQFIKNKPHSSILFTSK